MSDAPTRQIDVLRIIDAAGEVWMGMPTRGAHVVYDRKSDSTLPRRVWERLLDRGDLEVCGEWGYSTKMYLRLTDQGRARLGGDK